MVRLSGQHDGAEQAEIGRRVFRVAASARAALGQEGDALGQGPEQPLEIGGDVGQHIEAATNAAAGCGVDHARLVQAIERLAILRAVIAWRQHAAGVGPGLGAERQADGAARQAEQRPRRPGCSPSALPPGRERSRREQVAPPS